MKRTPLTRSTPLKGPSTPLRRSVLPRKPIPRLRPAKPQEPRTRLSLASAEIAFARSGSLCACGCQRIATDWHHAFDQNRYEHLADEPDNVFAVARYCHAMHTAAVKRFPRSMIAPAERLAVTGAMKRYIERTYA